MQTRPYAEANGSHTMLEAEAADIVRVLRGYGVLTKRSLTELCHAGRWRERKFEDALSLAVSHGLVRRLGSELYESVDQE